MIVLSLNIVKTVSLGEYHIALPIPLLCPQSDEWYKPLFMYVYVRIDPLAYLQDLQFNAGSKWWS